VAVIGYLDLRQKDRFFGWAWDPDKGRNTEIQIIVDGAPRATIRPDHPRPDVVEAGIASDICGFCWVADDDLHDGKPHDIVVMVGGQPLPSNLDSNQFTLPRRVRLAARQPLALPVEKLRPAIARINWFHSYAFTPAIQARGLKPLDILEQEAADIFRYDIAGRSVLDIGAWDGFFSYQAEARGAARVLATDHFSWGGEGWGTKVGFDLAHTLLGSAVESLEIDAMDVSPERLGRFDVVLFLGVLYHLRNPLLGLERAAAMSREMLVVETTLHMHHVSEPAMQFFPGRELNNDPTNWWSPNVACVKAMLTSLGFKRVEYLPYFQDRETGNPAPSRGVFHAFR